MTDKFTLQVSDSGAWRNVVKATKEQMQEIEHPAAMIASIMGNRFKMRIIHSALGTVVGYCQGPDFVWMPAEIDGGAK